MIEEDANVRYDRERCRVCGVAWLPFRDEHGRIFAGHPYGETCSRYRPQEGNEDAIHPSILANLPPVRVDEQEVVTSGYIHAEIVHAGGNGEVA